MADRPTVVRHRPNRHGVGWILVLPGRLWRRLAILPRMLMSGYMPHEVITGEKCYIKYYGPGL